MFLVEQIEDLIAHEPEKIEEICKRIQRITLDDRIIHVLF